MRYGIIGIILLLVGCTPVYECPTINCPEIICNETEIELEKEIGYEIDAGTKVNLVVDETFVDIINCGHTAYGLVVIDEINNIIKENNLEIRNLIINNTNAKYIGGCKDILIEFPEIQKVIIKDVERDTEEYKEFIKWIPSHKIEKFI